MIFMLLAAPDRDMTCDAFYPVSREAIDGVYFWYKIRDARDICHLSSYSCEKSQGTGASLFAHWLVTAADVSDLTERVLNLKLNGLRRGEDNSAELKRVGLFSPETEEFLDPKKHYVNSVT